MECKNCGKEIVKQPTAQEPSAPEPSGVEWKKPKLNRYDSDYRNGECIEQLQQICDEQAERIAALEHRLNSYRVCIDDSEFAAESIGGKHLNLRQYKSYQEYIDTQIEAHRRKAAHVFFWDKAAPTLAAKILTHCQTVTCGLCHGVRTGTEQDTIRRELIKLGQTATVIGTEICPDAARGSTIHWDFHNMRPDWQGAMDFVYSNSLDHAHNPDLAITTWINSLRPGGVVIIEWSPSHNEPLPEDPFTATDAEIRAWLLTHPIEIIEDSVYPIGETNYRRWFFLRPKGTA